MGILHNKIDDTQKEIKIILIGLDNSGKTTFLNRLILNQVKPTAPTIGYNLQQIQYNNLQVQVWDIGGQNYLRKEWEIYYPKTQAIVYIVDSNDPYSFHKAEEELNEVLINENLKGVPLLVLANKHDLLQGDERIDIGVALKLWSIKDRKWTVFECSAVTGYGVNEAMDWLLDILKK